MAIGYKSAGAGTSTETSGVNLAPACPATVDANDILIAHIVVLDATSALSTPSGWELLYGPSNLGTGTPTGRAWCYGKIAAGNEDGAKVNFGSLASTVGRLGRIYSFSGYVSGAITDVVPVASFAQNASETDPVIQQVTTTVAGAKAIALVSQDDNNTHAGLGAVTGGTWAEAVADYVDTAVGAQGAALQLQVGTPTSDPGTIAGGTVAGTDDEANTICFEIRPNTPPAVTYVDLNYASETSLAQALGKQKNINVSQVTETESAQAISVQKRINVGQVVPPSGDPTNLLSNSFNWTDTNTDGIADGWEKSYGTETVSIVTGNGFSGNAQRMLGNANGTAQAISPSGFTLDSTKTYSLSLRYRCNNTIVLFRGVSEVLDTIPTNTGDAVLYETTLSPTGNSDLRFFVPNQNDWFEIDEVELFDNSEVLPSGYSDEALTITPQLVAGADRIDVTQATETNTSQAVSKLKSKAIAQVSGNENAQAIGITKNISVTQVSSSDTAQAVTVFRRNNISVVQATETDSVNAVSKLKSKTVTQTIETDSVGNISKRKSKSVVQTLETDEAFTISSELRIETAFETDIAQSVTAQKLIAVIEATETDETFAINPTKQIAVTQTTETNTAEALSVQKRIGLCTSSSYEIYCDAVAGAVKYHFFLEKQSDSSYHLIDGMDYLNDARHYKIGESASPTFSITLPDDGSEYTSGIVAESGVGVYSDMRVEMFYTESIPVVETDQAQAINIIKLRTVEQITETDFANEITPMIPGVYLVTRVDEVETAFPIASLKLIHISAAEETEFAQGLAQILKRANISLVEETDLAIGMSSTAAKYVNVLSAFEVDEAGKIIYRSFDSSEFILENIDVNIIENGLLAVVKDNGISVSVTQDEIRSNITNVDIKSVVSYNLEVKVT